MSRQHVIDSLLWALKRERMHADIWDEKYEMLGDRRMTLITATVAKTSAGVSKISAAPSLNSR